MALYVDIEQGQRFDNEDDHSITSKGLAQRKELHHMREELSKLQNKVSVIYHKIVLPPIIWVIKADLKTAIENHSFETLLKVLSSFLSCQEQEINEEISKELLKNVKILQENVDKYIKTPRNDRTPVQEHIDKKYTDLIKQMKDVLALNNVSEVAYADQCYQLASQLIETSQDLLNEWCSHEDIPKIQTLAEEVNSKDESRTIPKPRSVLQNIKTHPSLSIMFKKTVIFRPLLEIILTTFTAYNELIQTDLESPLHYAIQNQDETFLEWLLNKESLDVNFRNRQKKTALFVLCEEYNTTRNSIIFSNAETNLNDLISTLETYQSFIKKLLKRGASLNVCSSKPLLPYNLLTERRFNFKGTLLPWMERCQHNEQQFFAAVEELAKQADHGGILKSNKKKMAAPTSDIHLTVEVLEIFLRFNEQDLFSEKIGEINLQEEKIKKVIDYLLHLAVEQNMENALRAIVSKCGKEIFMHEKNDQAKLKYRVELKGLLRKACDSGNRATLELLVDKMCKDKLLINDECILVYVLNRCGTLSDESPIKPKLLECAKWMASDGRIHQTKTDCNGNTALHAALRYKFMDIAKLLIKNDKHVFLGAHNNAKETPLDYAPSDFIKEYLDSCVKNMPKPAPHSKLLINLEAFNPYWFRKTNDDTEPFVLKVGSHKDEGNLKYFSMDCLKTISDSVHHRSLLSHPVLYTYILIEWVRYSIWHILNLFFTLIAATVFGIYAIEYICNNNFSFVLYILSWFGLAYVVMREILQWMVFGNQYFKAAQNWMDLSHIVLMILVLIFDFGSLVAALSVIIFSVQIIQLIGSLPFNAISTYRIMFRVVATNFIKSLALFCPLLIAFACSFYMFYNESQAQNSTVPNSEDLNKFGSAASAGIKIVVMATGEFEAASMNIDGNVIIIFLLFIFCVPMVIQNLINGLAISDISEIRSQSESISLVEKVHLLAQFQAGISRKSSKLVQKILQCIQQRSPAIFFKTFESCIKIDIDDHAKIKIKLRHPKQDKFCNNLACGSLQYSSGPSEDIELNNRQEANGPLLDRKTSRSSMKKLSKPDWQCIPRIPGLTTFMASLEKDQLHELIHIGKQQIR